MKDALDAGIPRHRYSIPMYLGAGGIATASHYVTTIALVELAHVEPLVASASGFAVGAGVKYWLNYFVAFRSAEPHSTAVPRFAFMLVLMFLLNLAFFALFNQWFGLHYVLAQVLTTGVLIPPGYLLSRIWVFRGAER
jgi:putative flippase GtrA